MLSIRNSIEQIESLVAEKYEFENKKQHFLEFSDYQGSVVKIKIIGVSIESYSTIVKLSTETSMQDIKLVVS